MRFWLDPASPLCSSKLSKKHLNTLKYRNFESRLYLDWTRGTAGSIGSAIRIGLIRAGRYSSTGQRVICFKTNTTLLRGWTLKGELRSSETPCAHWSASTFIAAAELGNFTTALLGSFHPAVTTISHATNFLPCARRPHVLSSALQPVPIEHLFAKLKHWLWKVRSRNALAKQRQTLSQLHSQVCRSILAVSGCQLS